MNHIVITGMPGTGKTHLAMGLGAALMEAGLAVLVLHTDILKVTLRQLHDGLKGPGYSGNFRAKANLMRPFLEAQVAKADRDGYILIVEGTLALGFCPPGLHLLLELASSEWKRRLSRKHPSAKRAIASSKLDAYRQALQESVTPATLRLDASLSVDSLVASILASYSQICSIN